MTTNTHETINFLANFLQVDNEIQPWANSWKKIKEEICQALDAEIFLSSYPNKNKLRLQLNSILDRMFVLSRFPQMHGQHIICHIAREKNSNDFGENFSICPSFLHNNDVPCIYNSVDVKKDNNFFSGIFNPHGGFTTCEPEEIYNKLKNIQMKNGELSAFFSSILTELPNLPNHITYIDIPQYCQSSNLFLKGFLNVAHTFFISDTYSPILIESLKHLSKTRPNSVIYVSGQNAFTKYKKQFPKLKFVNTLPALTENVFYSTSSYFLLKYFFQEPLSWFKNTIRHHQGTAASFTNDILMLTTNEEIIGELKKLRDVTHETLKNLKESYEKWENSRDIVLKLTQEMEKTFHCSTAPVDIKDIYGLSHDNWELAENFLELLVEERNVLEIKTHCELMRLSGYKYESILIGGLKAAQDCSVSSAPILDHSITKIDKQIAHRLCIKLHKELNLTPDEAGRNHAAHIQPYTADEWYFRALWEEQQLFNSGASLRKAIVLGSQEASKCLYLQLKKQLGSNVYQRGMKFLLRELMPEACYDIAIEKNNYSFTTRELFYLYIAAAQGHLLALEEIAKYEFLRSRPYNSDTEKVKKQKEISHKKALQLYSYLENKTELNSLSSCYFGTLLHDEKNFDRAQKHLSSSSEPRAFRLLGRMYHYGDGVSISLSKAIEYYESAVNGGDNNTQKLLDKAKEQLKMTHAKKRDGYSNTRNYSTSSRTTSSSSSSSGCFLTTATCRVMGFEDDCDVLQAYRKYRDNILLSDSDGFSIIQEYYRIAPNIIKQIDAQPNSYEIYKKMWDNYLSVGYKLLQEKKYTDAKQLYIKLVTELLQEYKVSM